jgi:hypothetical protein
MIVTWTTLSGVKGDDNVSSGDDIGIMHLSFLSLFLLLRWCWREQMIYKKKKKT